MSKELFKGFESILSKSETGEFLIDTEKDYSVEKVDVAAIEKEKKEAEDKTKESKEDLIEVPDVVEPTEDTTDLQDIGNIYKPLASLLKEEGVLPTLDLEKFTGTTEELIAGMQAEIKDGIEGYKESIPAAIKKLLDNYEEGVPYDELIGVQSEQMRLENIDENIIKENKELQKELVAYHLSQTTKWSEVKIKKEVDRLVDTDEIESEAYDAHKDLKKIAAETEKELIREAKEQAIKDRQKAKDDFAKLEKTVNDTAELIPGIKVTEKEKQNLLKAVTKAVAYTPDNKPVSRVTQVREKDPIKFDLMLNYFIDKGFFEGKFDAITTKAKTDSLKELEKQAATNLSKIGKTNLSAITTAKGSSILNALPKSK